MEFAALLLLGLVLMGKRTPPRESPGGASTPGGQEAGKTPTAPPLLGVVGSLAAGAKALAGAGGTTATTAATATATGAGAVSTGAVVALTLGNPLAWVVGVFIGTRVSQGMALHKTWASYLLNLNANAEGLASYEAARMRERLKPGSYTVESVRDGRLDLYVSGVDPIKFQGFREVFRYVPERDEPEKLWGLRFAAYEYLRVRAAVAYRMLTGWQVAKPEADFGMSPRKREGLYEAEAPGVGGLDAVPAPWGKTEAPRQDTTEPWPPVEQLRGVGIIAAPDYASESDLRAARFAGVLEALQALQWDPRFAIDADAEAYAENVYRTAVEGLGLDVGLDGEWLTFPAESWGTQVAVSPARIKRRERGAIKVGA